MENLLLYLTAATRSQEVGPSRLKWMTWHRIVWSPHLGFRLASRSGQVRVYFRMVRPELTSTALLFTSFPLMTQPVFVETHQWRKMS
jgi:hypothetical protein